MQLIGKKKLEKLKNKNLGNYSLSEAIELLIYEIENNDWKNHFELKETRHDADCIHSDGFYFFDVSIHRTMILIEFEEDGEATIVWCGNHQEYERTFKNNKLVIKKWLKKNDWI